MNEQPVALAHMRPWALLGWALIGLLSWALVGALAFGAYVLVGALT